jgi:hypothetical protein
MAVKNNMLIIVKTAAVQPNRPLLYGALMIGVFLSVVNLREGMELFADHSNHVHDMSVRRKTSTTLDDYVFSPPSRSHWLFSGGTNHTHETITPPSRRLGNHFPSLQLPQSRNETIIVGLANRAYMEVAILWYRRMTEAGFHNHRILAADQTSAWICEELGLRYDNLSKFTHTVVPSCHSSQTGHTGWRNKIFLFAARWIYVRQKLLEGYNVLLTDVDSVYNFHTPLSRLESDNYDHITAYADKMPLNVFQQTGFTVCGCFNWMRSTPSMIQYLDLFLANCGCTVEKNVNGTCKCGCDDQVTMNSMLFYQLDMVWDPYTGRMDDNDEFFQDSITGVSQRNGQRIKVLDRGLVYRGNRRNTCQEGNWITFPKSNGTETKMEQMKQLLGNCPLPHVLEKTLQLSNTEGENVTIQSHQV